jgi:hypothetical protein
LSRQYAIASGYVLKLRRKIAPLANVTFTKIIAIPLLIASDIADAKTVMNRVDSLYRENAIALAVSNCAHIEPFINLFVMRTMRACARCEHVNSAPKTSTKTQDDPGEPLCNLRAQNGQACRFLADVLKSGRQTLDGHMRSNAVLPPGVVCSA